MLRVVLASRDPRQRSAWEGALPDASLDVDHSESWDALIASLDNVATDVLLLDRQLLPVDAPERAVERLRARPSPPVLLVVSSGEGDAGRLRLLSSGATAVLPSKLDDDWRAYVAKVVRERARPHALSPSLRTPDATPEPDLDQFQSRNPGMQRLFALARRASKGRSSLLVLGETGVGKEWLARCIHTAGPRAHAPFVAVNCGGFPEALLESELFGHRKGAFTGAHSNRRGWFEVAHGGTLFLDEIGEMPTHLQVRLLRVLQDREVQPLGSEKAVKVDVRVVAATNRDVEADIETGVFRRDLYYRLGVLTLTLPPLRERPEDIPELVTSLLGELGGPAQISPEVMAVLRGYAWPGNVRELSNVLERALLLGDGESVVMEDLPDSVLLARGAKEAVALAEESGSVDFDRLAEEHETSTLPEARKAVLAAFESRYLQRLLAATQGKIGATATRAGIQPRSLFERMKLYGLRKEDFRTSSARTKDA